MVTKKCASEHCEEMFEANAPARKFCDLHATGKRITVDLDRHQPKEYPPQEAPEPIANEDLTAFIVPIYVTEPQLDDFWAKLPIEEKALAIQLYWDNSNT